MVKNNRIDGYLELVLLYYSILNFMKKEEKRENIYVIINWLFFFIDRFLIFFVLIWDIIYFIYRVLNIL